MLTQRPAGMELIDESVLDRTAARLREAKVVLPRFAQLAAPDLVPGGVREALGEVPARGVPGILVRPGDPGALTAALRWWLSDSGLRDELRSRALERRRHLAGWPVAAARLVRILAEVGA